jgi:hypothetical protein
VTRWDGRRSYDPAVSRSSQAGDVLLPADPGDDAGPLPPPAVLRLSAAGRAWRLAVSAIVLALVLAGTLWGSDAAFPVGPFRMYSTRADPDAPVVSTRVVGLTATGTEVRLSGGEVGLRRAEFEGQLPRLEADPSLLALLGESYARSHPQAPELVSVAVVQRRYELVDGRSTGRYRDSVLVETPLGGDG